MYDSRREELDNPISFMIVVSYTYVIIASIIAIAYIHIIS